LGPGITEAVAVFAAGCCAVRWPGTERIDTVPVIQKNLRKFVFATVDFIYMLL
jgi:hypothetical protein